MNERHSVASLDHVFCQVHGGEGGKDEDEDEEKNDKKGRKNTGTDKNPRTRRTRTRRARIRTRTADRIAPSVASSVVDEKYMCAQRAHTQPWNE
jgi:hypothetical protein